MDLFLLTLFFGPGVMVGSTVWRQFLRPNRSFRHWAIAMMSAVASFLAMEFFILFALGWWMNAQCEDFRECHPWISKDSEFAFLVVSCLCGVVTYAGLSYRRRLF